MNNSLKIEKLKRITGIIGILITISLIWFIIIRPAIADVYLQKMMSINLESRYARYEIQDFHNTITFYAKFTAGEIPYRYRYINSLLKLASIESDSKKKIELFQEAQKELDIIYIKNPEDFDYYLTLGRLMGQWGKIDFSKYEEMNKVFEIAAANSPNYAPTYYLWGKGLKEAGSYQKAKEKFSQAVILFSDPDFPGTENNIKESLSIIRTEILKELKEIEQLLQ